MKLTLVVALLAWLTIYSNCSVLSLPPSLIANAASLRHHQQQQQLHEHEHRPLLYKLKDDHNNFASTKAEAAANNDFNALWKKDNQQIYFDTNKNLAAAERANVGDVIGGGVIGLTDDQIRQMQSTNNINNNQQNNNIPLANNAALGATQAKLALQHELNLNRNSASTAYDLNGLMSPAKSASTSADAIKKAELLLSPLHQNVLRQQQQHHAIEPRELFTPLRYWARYCQPGNNCPQEYYHALLADRNKADATTKQKMQHIAFAATKAKNAADIGDDSRGGGVVVTAAAAAANDNMNAGAANMGNDDVGVVVYENNDGEDDDEDLGNYDNIDFDVNEDYENAVNDDHLNNEILMLLNGEQDLVKFLHWAMEQLYPYQKFANLTDGNGADYYYPGMYIWKKLNLSGRLEPPLIVEEPHYVIVRREQLQEDLQGSKYRDDPFIPPRGRKHNMPDLDALLHRSELFVPNRGRRDKIKDLFKYDDLFYPNRGKKQKPPTKTASLAPAIKVGNNYENVQGNENINMPFVGLKDISIDERATRRFDYRGDDIESTSTSNSNNNNNNNKWLTDAQNKQQQQQTNDAAMENLLMKLKRKLHEQQQQQQQQNCVQHNDVIAPHRNMQKMAIYQQQQQQQQEHQPIDYNHNNKYNKWAQQQQGAGMSMHKINGCDQQSVKPANRKLTTMPTKTFVDMSTDAWPAKFIDTRLRRVATGGGAAARIVANKLHSLRSMSAAAATIPEKKKQKQKLHNQQQQQLQNYYHFNQQPQQKQNQRRQQKQHESDTEEFQRQQRWQHQKQSQSQLQQQQQHEQQQKTKSMLNYLEDPLLWRHLQLQLLQQKQQQSPEQQQKQQMSPHWQHLELPPETTQLNELISTTAAGGDISSGAAVADAFMLAASNHDVANNNNNDAFANDIDYFYINI